MLEQLKTWDRDLLLFLNQFHSSALDGIVPYLTRTDVWIPLYVVLLYLIFKSQGKEGWFVVLGITVSVLLTDRITSGLMKPFFERLRPSQEPSLEGLVHLVDNYKGGLYGFASSHAANTMGVAMVVFLTLRPVYRYAWLVFLWACIMSYTRIYLGVHYPGDILTGTIIGLACGYAGYRTALWSRRKWRERQAKAA